MDCVVTAGPTFEPLDQVRRLTNFSTGRLGTALAEFLSRQGHRVTLFRSEAVAGAVPPVEAAVPFTTTEDLLHRLRALAGPEVQAIFHTAAVSDFRFGRIYRQTPAHALEPIQAGKVPSREGSLLAELIPTPKIIRELRDWFPQAWLAGWKYEVDGDPASAQAAGLEQLRICRTDACVVNGPAYGAGFGFLQAGAAWQHLPDQASLFSALLRSATARGAPE